MTTTTPARPTDAAITTASYLSRLATDILAGDVTVVATIEDAEGRTPPYPAPATHAWWMLRVTTTAVEPANAQTASVSIEHSPPKPRYLYLDSDGYRIRSKKRAEKRARRGDCEVWRYNGAYWCQAEMFGSIGDDSDDEGVYWAVMTSPERLALIPIRHQWEDTFARETRYAAPWHATGGDGVPG